MHWTEACKKSLIGIAKRIDLDTEVESIYYKYQEGHIVGKKNGYFYYNNIPIYKIEGFLDWEPCYKY